MPAVKLQTCMKHDQQPIAEGYHVQKENMTVIDVRITLSSCSYDSGQDWRMFRISLSMCVWKHSMLMHTNTREYEGGSKSEWGSHVCKAQVQGCWTYSIRTAVREEDVQRTRATTLHLHITNGSVLLPHIQKNIYVEAYPPCPLCTSPRSELAAAQQFSRGNLISILTCITTHDIFYCHLKNGYNYSSIVVILDIYFKTNTENALRFWLILSTEIHWSLVTLAKICDKNFSSLPWFLR